MMSKKKGQVSIFMIVAVIIIIGGIAFFAFTKENSQGTEFEVKISQENIPTQLDPVKKYVADCLYSTSAEALAKIGDQGGYVSFDDRNLNRENFAVTKNPTEGDMVLFADNAELRIPYWYYLKSSNNCRGNCVFATRRPELRTGENSIEKQMERYVNAKLKDCIDNFNSFADKGYGIRETGQLKSDVVITKNDVAVVIEYPLDVQKDDVKASMKQFYTRVPVNLDRIYDLATKITNLEQRHRFIEKHAMNLVVAFSGVDKSKLPPISDMQFKLGSTTTWRKSEIKNKITGMLSSYVPLFQVDGTLNYERNQFETSLEQRLYDSTIIPVANSSFENLAAEFTYLDFWPVYFDLNCDGERCVPGSINSLVSFFGIQSYNFAYDISFPVLVEITDPQALNGQGYKFNLFLEGNVRNNKPMPSEFVPLERAEISERSLLCDSRTSKNVTVIAQKSGSINEPVSDVQVFYTLLDESCFIGTTNANGILVEQFPVGIGGAVSFVKDGLVGKSIEFDASIGKEDALKAELNPINTKKLVVKKKRIVKTEQGWRFDNTPVGLNEKESALVALTRANDAGELDFSSIANFEPKQDTEIEIAPGKYEADVNLILNERIIIPEDKRCVAAGIFGKTECYTIPKIDFGERATAGMEKFPEGGLKLNFTINAADLEKSGTIVLYVVAIDISSVPERARKVEDIEQIGKIEDYSKSYQLALWPSFE